LTALSRERHPKRKERALKSLTALLAAVAFVVGSIGFVAAQTPAAGKKMPVKTANGTVKSATADSVVIVGKDRGKDVDWTFSVNDATQIKKAGKAVTAPDLAPGDGVNVRYTDYEGKSVASVINVRSKPAGARDTATTAPETKPADKQ